MKYVFRTVLCLTLCICLSCIVFGKEQTQRCSVSLHFGENGRRFADAPFRIYRVAQIGDDGEFEPLKAFADYPIDRSDDPAVWRALAQTLSAYVGRDAVTPTAHGQTDKNGDVVFANLDDGLYLAVGDLVKTEKTTVQPTPMLLCLPSVSEDGRPVTDLVCSVKYEEKPIETVCITAIKIWEKDNEKIRPTAVTAQLLKNGEVFSEAVLNAQNNWKHTWENLDSGIKWEVAEKVVPADYTVRIDRSGNSFSITNTYGKTPPDKPDLPQTGLLQWPIPILTASGLLCLCIGLLRRKQNGR